MTAAWRSERRAAGSDRRPKMKVPWLLVLIVLAIVIWKLRIIVWVPATWTSLIYFVVFLVVVYAAADIGWHWYKKSRNKSAAA